MAFIPDDALDRYGELQPASQLGYSFICQHRFHKTGIAPKTIDECAAKYKWSRATKFNVQKELQTKGWIEKAGNGWRPIVGDFSPASKSKKLDFVEPLESKNLDLKSKKLDSKSKNLDSPLIRNNQPLPASYQKEDVSNETSGSFARQVTEIFEFWKAELNHGAAKFTNERRRKVIARLKDDYTVEQIKTAIKGCRVSPFHQGQNDSGIIHDDLELICRKAINLERFISIYEGNQTGAKNGKIQPNSSKYPAKRTDADNFRESAEFYRDWEAREQAAAGNHTG